MKQSVQHQAKQKRSLSGGKSLHETPRWLRPKLSRDQRIDLGLAHMINLTAVSKGHADEDTLWEMVAGVLTWSRVSQMLQAGVPEMLDQLAMVTAMIARYGRTGLVVFTGPEYELAKKGAVVMDLLAEMTDTHTAIEAAAWSEMRVALLSAEVQSATQAAHAEATA